MDRRIDIIRLELTADGLHGSCLIVKGHHRRVDSVCRKSVIVDIYGNLFLLGTEYLHIGQGRDSIEFAFQQIRIFLKLPIALVLRLQGEEYRRNCTELIHHLHGQDT